MGATTMDRTQEEDELRAQQVAEQAVADDDAGAGDTVGSDPAGDARTGLFDQEIEDEALAAALDRREKLRVAKAAATKAYKDAHDVVKGKVDALDLEDEVVVRCGRHRIEFRPVAARSVSFEAAATRRLQIKLFDPDA